MVTEPAPSTVISPVQLKTVPGKAASMTSDTVPGTGASPHSVLPFPLSMSTGTVLSSSGTAAANGSANSMHANTTAKTPSTFPFIVRPQLLKSMFFEYTR